MVYRNRITGNVAITTIAILAISILPVEAGVDLTVQDGLQPNEMILTWSGGTPPYTVYMGLVLPNGGNEKLVASTTATTYTVVVNDEYAYFRVADSSAPPNQGIAPVTI